MRSDLQIQCVNREPIPSCERQINTLFYKQTLHSRKRAFYSCRFGGAGTSLISIHIFFGFLLLFSTRFLPPSWKRESLSRRHIAKMIWKSKVIEYRKRAVFTLQNYGRRKTIDKRMECVSCLAERTKNIKRFSFVFFSFIKSAVYLHSDHIYIPHYTIYTAICTAEK